MNEDKMELEEAVKYLKIMKDIMKDRKLPKQSYVR